MSGQLPGSDSGPPGSFQPTQGLSDASDALASGSPQAVRKFAQDVQGWAKGAADLKASAEAGRFAVDPVAGQAYRELYDRCLDKIRHLQVDIFNITQTYQLGTTPGAQVISPWNLQVARELQAAFHQLSMIYSDAQAAYAQAMRNYQEGERSVSDSLWKVGGGG